MRSFRSHLRFRSWILAEFRPRTISNPSRIFRVVVDRSDVVLNFGEQLGVEPILWSRLLEPVSQATAETEGVHGRRSAAVLNSRGDPGRSLTVQLSSDDLPGRRQP